MEVPLFYAYFLACFNFHVIAYTAVLQYVIQQNTYSVF